MTYLQKTGKEMYNSCMGKFGKATVSTPGELQLPFRLLAE